jgi:hypothetical protein
MPEGYITLFLFWMLGCIIFVIFGLLLVRYDIVPPKDALAAILLGPAYFLFKHMGWKLSLSRGWFILLCLTFLLVTFAPFISYWLEN